MGASLRLFSRKYFYRLLFLQKLRMTQPTTSMQKDKISFLLTTFFQDTKCPFENVEAFQTKHFGV